MLSVSLGRRLRLHKWGPGGKAPTSVVAQTPHPHVPESQPRATDTSHSESSSAFTFTAGVVHGFQYLVLRAGTLPASRYRQAQTAAAAVVHAARVRTCDQTHGSYTRGFRRRARVSSSQHRYALHHIERGGRTSFEVEGHNRPNATSLGAGLTKHF